MVNCAAFGCNNKAGKGSGLSFFHFPKDSNLRKQWIYYCRRKDFTPGDGHRLCSVHFSNKCYDQDPEMLSTLGLEYSFRKRLKPDAVPDIPLLFEEEQGNSEKPSKVRGAYAKRQRAEVLNEALNESLSLPFDDSLENISIPENLSTEPSKETRNKKVQVDLHPPQRTRSNQTDERIVSLKVKQRSFGTQTDESITQVQSISSLSHQVMEDIPSDELEDNDEDSTEEEEEDSDELYLPDDSDLEVDDDEDGEGEVQTATYKLRQDTAPMDEKQFLVSETALAELLSVCRYCSAECTPVIKFFRGTFIYTSSKCLNGHEFTWSSQPCHNTLPWSNLFTATAILTSGCNATKVLQVFKNMNLQMFTARTYNRLQAYYVVPSATKTWDFEQSQLLTEIKDGASQDVVVGGDARCDSPGYSAKYGTYTIMDLERNKILDFQLVQSNEVKGSSHMELAGLKRAMGFLKDHVNIKTLVTDRHSMVKKYMKDCHAEKNHYFDVWHIAKGVSKKLETASKKVSGEQIRPWIKSIANHCHWTASSSEDDGELKQAKWASVVNHIANKHENHSRKYPRCEHAPINDERLWIKEDNVFKISSVRSPTS
nr:uncharacterized protein LOC117692019 [Crassostrea gigas]